MRMLRDRLFKGILESIDHVLVNGSIGNKRVFDNVNISFLYVEGEALAVKFSLREIYVSSESV